MSAVSLQRTKSTAPRPNRRRIARWLSAALFSVLGAVLLCWGLSPGEASSDASAAVPAHPRQPKYQTRAIQDIRPGDIVMAREETGHAINLKEVVETYVRTSDHLRILTFESEDGRRQTLKTTNEHPFWLVNEGAFVEAEQLSLGDQVTGPGGELQRLVSTVYELHPVGIPVYNFQVDDYHTYFVNENATRAPPALVHNADYTPEGGIPKRIYRGGRYNESAYKDIRVDADGVSFRNSLSNSVPAAGEPPAPVLRPGKPYIEVDTSKLPPGSVIPDDVPPGHVTVTATLEEILNAIIGGGKFPKK